MDGRHEQGHTIIWLKKMFLGRIKKSLVIYKFWYMRYYYSILGFCIPITQVWVQFWWGRTIKYGPLSLLQVESLNFFLRICEVWKANFQYGRLNPHLEFFNGNLNFFQKSLNTALMHYKIFLPVLNYLYTCYIVHAYVHLTKHVAD